MRYVNLFYNGREAGRSKNIYHCGRVALEQLEARYCWSPIMSLDAEAGPIDQDSLSELTIVAETDIQVVNPAISETSDPNLTPDDPVYVPPPGNSNDPDAASALPAPLVAGGPAQTVKGVQIPANAIGISSTSIMYTPPGGKPCPYTGGAIIVTFVIFPTKHLSVKALTGAPAGSFDIKVVCSEVATDNPINPPLEFTCTVSSASSIGTVSVGSMPTV